MVAIGRLEYSKQIPVSDNMDLIDAISSGINMLSEELYESIVTKEYMDNLINSIQTPIVVIEKNGRIIHFNKSLVSVLGYSEKELKDNSFQIIVTKKLFKEILKNEHISNLEITYKTKEGDLIPVLFTSSVVHSVNTRENNTLVCVARDISERKEMEEQIKLLAFFDHLTGLPNRVLLQERFNVALNLAKRNQEQFAVMLFDLDFFKDVNDTLGHDIGDKLLKIVADRVIQNLRDCDTLARIGGDEFVVLLQDFNDFDQVDLVAKRILKALNRQFEINGNLIHISCSIGIAVHPDNGSDYITLLKNADIAMYRAKNAGGSKFIYF